MADEPQVVLTMLARVRCPDPGCRDLPPADVDHETAAWFKWACQQLGTDAGRNVRQVASGVCNGAMQMLQMLQLPPHALLHALAEAIACAAVGQGAPAEDVLELVRMQLAGEHARAVVHGTARPQLPLPPRLCSTPAGGLA